MTLNLNDSQLKKIYFNNNEVASMYLGETLVYEKQLEPDFGDINSDSDSDTDVNS